MGAIEFRPAGFAEVARAIARAHHYRSPHDPQRIDDERQNQMSYGAPSAGYIKMFIAGGCVCVLVFVYDSKDAHTFD